MPLTIKPPSRPAQSPPVSASPPTGQTYSSEQDRETSPEPPPASPLTPVARPAKPATQPDQASQAQFIQQPPSLPFSAEDSTDAIALRAAISSLQFQRLQAQKDLRVLEDIKRQAVAHPEEYQQQVLLKGQVKPQPPPWKTPLDPEEDQVDDHDAIPGAQLVSADDSTLYKPGSALDSSQSPRGPRVSYGSMLHPKTHKSPEQSLSFPSVPLPQDVVRCPPIEWAKYNIVGESLDKLHQDQQLRPGGDESGAQRDSVIAAPYNPFLDRLSEEQQQQQQPVTDSSTNRKDSGASAPEQPVHRRRPSKAFP